MWDSFYFKLETYQENTRNKNEQLPHLSSRLVKLGENDAKRGGKYQQKITQNMPPEMKFYSSCDTVLCFGLTSLALFFLSLHLRIFHLFPFSLSLSFFYTIFTFIFTFLNIFLQTAPADIPPPHAPPGRTHFPLHRYSPNLLKIKLSRSCS
jgi:hypothetical protein